MAAPFTSRNVNIGCVPQVIKEGRATLVSAFASFKFGVAFCFTQLISVLMVFYVSTLIMNGKSCNDDDLSRSGRSLATTSTWWRTSGWRPSPSC